MIEKRYLISYTVYDKDNDVKGSGWIVYQLKKEIKDSKMVGMIIEDIKQREQINPAYFVNVTNLTFLGSTRKKEKEESKNREELAQSLNQIIAEISSKAKFNEKENKYKISGKSLESIYNQIGDIAEKIRNMDGI